jgi:hypothetical protein
MTCREKMGRLILTMSDNELNAFKQCLREENSPVSLRPTAIERYIGDSASTKAPKRSRWLQMKRCQFVFQR